MDSQRCSNCRSENRTEARFCKRCGFWLLPSCPFCNTILPEGAFFCDRCGRQLSPQLGSASPVPDARTPSLSVTSHARQEGPTASRLPPKESKRSQPASPIGASELRQYIPEELMKKLQAARDKGGMVGERRVVTMLFCDLKGSTAAAEGLDP